MGLTPHGNTPRTKLPTLDGIAGQVGGGHWPDRDREQQILAGGNVKKGWEEQQFWVLETPVFHPNPEE